MALYFEAANKDQKIEIALHINRILSLLDSFQHLVDAYVSDFFVSELWSTIPKGWWEILPTLEPEEIANLLSPHPSSHRRVWPLSLLAFRTTVHALALPRRPVSEEVLSLLMKMKIKADHCSDSSEKTVMNSWRSPTTAGYEKSLLERGALLTNTTEQGISARDEIKSGQYRLLQHCYRRHVKPKKQHEITRLAETIDAVCSELDLHHVVDVGAGQGHLSRLLSFGYGLTVTTVEAAGGHAPKAEKYDSEVTHDVVKGRLVKAKDRKKQRQRDGGDLDIESNKALSQMLSSPTHVVGMVSPDVSVDEFLTTLQFTSQTDIQSVDRNERPTTGGDCSQGRSGLPGSCQQTYSGGEISLTNACKNCSGTSEGPATFKPSKNAEISYHEIDCKDKLNQDHIGDENGLTYTVAPNNYIDMKTSCDDHDAGAHSKQLSDIGSVEHTVNHDSLIRCCSEHVSVELDDSPYTLEITVGDCLLDGAGSVEKSLSCDAQDATGSLSSCSCSRNNAEERRHGLDAATNTPKFLLTGLHACGDLTPTMLRVFVKCPPARALASVGCCYMKMTRQRCEARSVDGGHCGYPMSDAVQQLPWPTLSWEALEMGCHFMDEYHQRLIANGPSLKSHVYRSALQEIIHDKDPGIIHGSIKLTLKKTYQLPFQLYAEKALCRLNLEPSLTDSQLARAQSRLQDWRSVVAFYTLRLSMAPLVETVVLLDRVLYLMEQGVSGCLVPIFDPSLSPRNFVLLAWKS